MTPAVVFNISVLLTQRTLTGTYALTSVFVLDYRLIVHLKFTYLGARNLWKLVPLL